MSYFKPVKDFYVLSSAIHLNEFIICFPDIPILTIYTSDNVIMLTAVPKIVFMTCIYDK